MGLKFDIDTRHCTIITQRFYLNVNEQVIMMQSNAVDVPKFKPKKLGKRGLASSFMQMLGVCIFWRREFTLM